MARDLPPLHGLDLNLLVTLRALLREQSVTRAAERLGQTQPTVSRALASLRVAFDDELLVRAGRAMAPTALASSLRDPLERTLAALDRLPSLGAFDPEHDERTFRLVLPDVVGQQLLPALMARLQEAPGLRLQVGGSEQDVLHALLTDEVDLVIGAPILDQAELLTRRIGHPLPWSVVLGADVPDVGGALPLDVWLAAAHLQLVPGGRPDEGSGLDQLLARRGLARTVRLHLPYMAAVGETLARTDLVCTLPTLSAEAVATPHGLRVVPLPLEGFPRLPLRMTWHRTLHDDAGHRWLRDVLASIATGLTERWA